VLKAMSKNPANRYQSAAEMRSDLVRVLRGQRPMAPAVMTEEERTALLHGGSIGNTAAGGLNTVTRRLNSSTGATRHAAPPSWENTDPNRRSTAKTVGIGVGVVALLAIIAFVATRIFGGPTAPEQVLVKDVTGQVQEHARDELNALGLQATVAKEASDPNNVGKVTRTDPPAGSKVDKNSRIALFIGTGPAQATVPDLSGKSSTEAQTLLQNNGLVLAEPAKSAGTTNSNLVNKVTDQDPKPGATVAGGSRVTITVGTLQPQVTVPQVIGLTVDEASQALSRAGLKAQVSSDSGRAASDAVVVSSSPSSGQQAASGSSVTLKVLGGDQVQMPNLRNLTKNDARDALRSAGVKRSPDFFTVSVNNPDQDGRVVDQSVAPGQGVDPEQQVQVYVGKYEGGSGSGNSGASWAPRRACGATTW